MTPTRSLICAVALALVPAAVALPAVARDVVTRTGGKTIVDAPTTRVTTVERTGETRVKVRAPYANVDVDTSRQQVRIRVPYYSGDIRW